MKPHWSELIVRYRKTVLVITVLLTGFAAAGMKNLYFDSSTDIWFLKKDPVLVDYQALKDRFHNDEFLAVGIKAADGRPDVMNPETLSAIQRMTDFLEQHPAVDKVRSLTKYQYIHNKEGLLRVDDLFPSDRPSGEYSPAEWNSFRSILRGETIAHGLLFTSNLKHAVVAARVVNQKDYTGEGIAKNTLALDFKDFVEREGLNHDPAFELFLSGSAMISASYFHFSVLDQSITYPIMAVLILLFLFFLSRTWTGVVMPMALVTASVIVTLGAVGFFHWPMNMLNMIIPTVLTVTALGNAIHILVGFYEERGSGVAPRQAAALALRKNFLPCVYTTLTTVVGFLALATSRLAPVVEFGLAMSVGMAASFFFSVAGMPALLSYVNSKPSDEKRMSSSGRFARAIHSLTKYSVAKRGWVLWISAVSLIPIIYYCAQIKVDTNFVRNFREDVPITKGLRYFDDTYKGALSLEFMVDSGAADGVKDPAFLNKVLKFQNAVGDEEGTGRPNSLINYLMKINQVMHDGSADYYRLPDTRNLVAQYMLLYSSAGPDEDLSDLVTFDGRWMRVSVPFAVASSNVTRARVNAILAQISRDFPDLSIKTTGRAVLFNNMDVYVLQGCLSSFGLSFLTMLICFFLLLRSFKYGIVAMAPNIFPILAVGAIMGAFDIFLDFATLMVGAVTLGIVVDDTIHLQSRYVAARRRGLDFNGAHAFAISESGLSVMSTTVILVAGFSALSFSSFVPNVYMGILGCFVFVMAGFMELIFMPALLSFVDRNSAPSASPERKAAAESRSMALSAGESF